MVASKAPDLIHIYEDRVREVRRRLDICVICDSSERATIFKNEPWCSDNCRKEYFKAHNPQPVEMSVDDRDKKSIYQLADMIFQAVEAEDSSVIKSDTVGSFKVWEWSRAISEKFHTR